MKVLREYIRLLIEQSDSPKVVFMAGGPGAGKSSVINGLGLRGRLTVVNPDEEYERALTAENIPLDRQAIMDEYIPIKDQYTAAALAGDDDLVAELEPEYLRLRGLLSRNMKLFTQARKQAKEQQVSHIAAGEEFLVDGTGGNYNEIAKQVQKLRSAGYEVAMIFVDVPLEASIERDRSRGEAGHRRLGAEIVEKSWRSVDRNKPLYKKLFGKNFIMIDASGENFRKSLDSASEKVRRFLG